ncbi:MAG: hypothetical protein ACYCR4_02620 [Acidimicrobiales bacterium]
MVAPLSYLGLGEDFEQITKGAPLRGGERSAGRAANEAHLHPERDGRTEPASDRPSARRRELFSDVR